MKPGLYVDIPADVYHGDPCERPSLTRSVAQLLCTSSPRHAWTKHPRLNPAFVADESERFDIGTVAHDLLLAGSEDKVVLVDAADWRTKDAKEARDQARADGRTPLLVKHWEAVQAMVAAAHEQLAEHDADPPLFKDGIPEQTLVWEEPGDVTCRARLDWLHNGLTAIDDYKTTSRTANPEAWSRSLFGSGYDLQAAFYLRGLQAVTGCGPDVPFRFMVQETYPPYALSVVALTPAALTLAADKVVYALELWRDCLERDHWPAYTNRVCWAELPTFEEARWLEREAREEIAA